MSRHLIRDRRMAAAAGVVCLIAGAWLLRDAYENRGVRRPFALSLVPGG